MLWNACSCSRRPHAALCDLSGCSTALYPTLTPLQPPVFYSQVAPHLTSAGLRQEGCKTLSLFRLALYPLSTLLSLLAKIETQNRLHPYENRRRPLFDSDTALRYNTASTFGCGKKPIPFSHVPHLPRHNLRCQACQIDRSGGQTTACKSSSSTLAQQARSQATPKLPTLLQSVIADHSVPQLLR
ncbi:hypothetical protein M422DRAFT_246027 [Sphaerobolus stellatus SS14]|nr:hypothetical protein M422DRAFT_246027 [Sphaerobolus stellatus SS14]